MGRSSGNNRSDFDCDLDHDQDPGIFGGFFIGLYLLLGFLEPRIKYELIALKPQPRLVADSGNK